MIVDRSPMTNSESKDVLTRNNESMNHKCLGSRMRDGLRDQPLTEVATKLRKSSTSFRETLSPSNDGSDAPLAPRLDSLHQNGMLSSKANQSTLIPSSALFITSTALTKASGVLELLKSSLEDQSQSRKLKLLELLRDQAYRVLDKNYFSARNL